MHKKDETYIKSYDMEYRAHMKSGTFYKRALREYNDNDKNSFKLKKHENSVVQKKEYI